MKNSMYTFNLNKEDGNTDEPSVESRQQASAILLGIAGVIFAPFIVWLSWNLSMPFLFGLPAIGYIKSLALYILFRTLFK
jgi:hypothetical protein